ncbi:glycosyl hydrolase [Persicobacter diffluens]|uniref:Glycosyl hydrolases family 2 sugar binding domain-containing protein n=1 Tax=Persicobacter diffluens TaxID=981 RepID=A0AAN4W3R2_9BACT|nr:hypothetical protein PEDI_48910 [Persicobacter diffluens]
MRFSIFSITGVLFLWASLQANSQNIEQQFTQPPKEYQPGTIWRWIGGCVSDEGIAHDMKALADKGISMVEHFDIEGHCFCDTTIHDEKWMKHFRFALDEAKKNGLTFRKVPTAGWGLGSQHFTKEQGAKRITFAETTLQGGQQIHQQLPLPELPEGYKKEIAVLAIPEKGSHPPKPLKVTDSGHEKAYFFQQVYTAENVVDMDPHTPFISYKANGTFDQQWLEWEYEQDYLFEQLFISPKAKDNGDQRMWNCRLERADSKGIYDVIHQFQMQSDQEKLVEFRPTKGHKFRLVFQTDYNENIMIGEAWLLRANDKSPVREGIKWWKTKTANQGVWDYPAKADGGNLVVNDYYSQAQEADIQTSEVIDLSDQMNEEGVLQWAAPEGRWTILRFCEVLVPGHSRSASHLRPQGYEGNPFDTKTLDILFEKSIDPMIEVAGEHTGTTFNSLLFDSWEIGALEGAIQPTWTDNFMQIFQEKNGYDLKPYLPILAHRIVESREISNRFMYDYRKTLADLYLEFFEYYTTLAHDRKLKTSAQNGYGTMPHPHIDGLTAFGKVDIPQCEFWVDETNRVMDYFCDPIRTASSAANIYGKPYITAEAFTRFKAWAMLPAAYKNRADEAFCNGLNQVIFSVFSHKFQPDAKPGITVGSAALDTNVPWWNYSDSFHQYLSRCNYMLQKGQHVADFAYFIGEGSLKFVPGRQYLKPALPNGYDYDGINAEILLIQAQVKAGRLRLKSGMEYKYLVLPHHDQWTASPKIIQQLYQLAKQGLTIVGQAPARTDGLVDRLREKEFQQICEKMWPSKGQKVHALGKGRIVQNMPLEQLLQLDQQLADLEVEDCYNPHDIIWTHRKDHKQDIYFVVNQNEKTSRKARLIFNADRKQPQLFDPLTGSVRACDKWKREDNRIIINHTFAPNESMFFVLTDEPNKDSQVSYNTLVLKEEVDLSFDWTLTFDPSLGGPKSPQHFAYLQSWSTIACDDIHYYSGMVQYEKKFFLTSEQYEMIQKGKLMVDLGEVAGTAQVIVNGHRHPSNWCAPYQASLKENLKIGENLLQVEVASTFFNRIIYEQRIPAYARILSTNEYPNMKSKLQPSGLLGPVNLKIYEHRLPEQ